MGRRGLQTLRVRGGGRGGNEIDILVGNKFFSICYI